MLGIWVVALFLYDGSSVSEHSLPHIGLTACVYALHKPFAYSTYRSRPLSTMLLVPVSTLPRNGLTACVCSAYGPSNPLHVRHMGLDPYL